MLTSPLYINSIISDRSSKLVSRITTIIGPGKHANSGCSKKSCSKYELHADSTICRRKNEHGITTTNKQNSAANTHTISLVYTINHGKKEKKVRYIFHFNKYLPCERECYVLPPPEWCQWNFRWKRACQRRWAGWLSDFSTWDETDLETWLLMLAKLEFLQFS